MHCHLTDQRSLAFTIVFWPCCLRAEISPDPVNLLMTLWIVDYEISKFLAIVC